MWSNVSVFGGLALCFDSTTAVCGGGLAEDSRGPNDEVATCVAVVGITLSTLVAGYEIDIMSTDYVVDSCVLMLMVVVETVALACVDSVGWSVDI